MPKIVDREKMQNGILDAAMTVYATKGYHAATIADVADAAGLGKGTLYLYFKNKDAIAEAMVDRHFAKMGEQFCADPKLTTLGAFLDGLRVSMDVTEEHAAFIRVFFEVFGPRFASETFSRKVARFFDELGAHNTDVLRHLQATGEIRDDVDVDAAGRALASLVDGMILHRGLFGISKSRNTKLMGEAITLFRRGLEA